MSYFITSINVFLKETFVTTISKKLMSFTKVGIDKLCLYGRILFSAKKECAIKVQKDMEEL